MSLETQLINLTERIKQQFNSLNTSSGYVIPFISSVSSVLPNVVNAEIFVKGYNFIPTTTFSLTGFTGLVTNINIQSPVSATFQLSNSGNSGGDYPVIATNSTTSTSQLWGLPTKNVKVSNATGTGLPGINITNFEDNTKGSWIETGNRLWTINSGGTGSSGTGATSATEGVNYLYTEMSSPIVAGDVFSLETSDFANATEVRFLIHRFSSSLPDWSTLTLDYSPDNGDTWVNIETWDGNVQAAQGDDFIELFYDISNTPVTRLRFRQEASSSAPNIWRSDSAIDNIRITSI